MMERPEWPVWTHILGEDGFTHMHMTPEWEAWFRENPPIDRNGVQMFPDGRALYHEDMDVHRVMRAMHSLGVNWPNPVLRKRPEKV